MAAVKIAGVYENCLKKVRIVVLNAVFVDKLV